MMRQNIKMIGLDLDGTLLNTQKVLTDHTKEVLQKAMEQGVVVLPATGRSVAGLPADLLALSGVRYALTANGAKIVDLADGQIIYEKLVPYDMAEKLLDIMERYDTLIEVYHDGVGYSSEDMLKRVHEFFQNPAMADYVIKTRRKVPDVREMFTNAKRPSDKVQAIFLHEEERQMAWKQIVEVFPEVEITSALSNNMEVNAPGVSKGKTLLHLGKLLGIKREEIMAIGDGTNDIDMLKEAGLGVAMANAVACVKEAADLVTDSNDEEGVAKAIEKYVLYVPES